MDRGYLRRLFPKSGSVWLTVSIISLGVVVGLIAFLFKESEAISYMSDDPKTCVNCHVMIPEYNSWMKSSHREWTTCNDCHVPQDSIVKKYFFKAKDGLYHASVFTLRQEPQVIRIKSASQEVVQQNCIRCHLSQVTDVKYSSWIDKHVEKRVERTCWSCHQEVPHTRVHGLSSTRFTLAPIPTKTDNKIIPDWLVEKLAKNKK